MTALPATGRISARQAYDALTAMCSVLHDLGDPDDLTEQVHAAFHASCRREVNAAELRSLQTQVNELVWIRMQRSELRLPEVTAACVVTLYGSQGTATTAAVRAAGALDTNEITLVDITPFSTPELTGTRFTFRRVS